MILPDYEIGRRLYVIFPDHWEGLLASNRVQPASVDLTVKGPLCRVGSLDPKENRPIRPGESFIWSEPIQYRDEAAQQNVWVLQPGYLYLMSTHEKIHTPVDLVGRVDGRSSWGRVGLRVHATAGFIDPGFIGNITLELDVVGPASVEIREGDSICQVSFHTLTGPVSKPYGKDSKYQGQVEVTASRPLEKGNSR